MTVSTLNAEMLVKLEISDEKWLFLVCNKKMIHSNTKVLSMLIFYSKL